MGSSGIGTRSFLSSNRKNDNMEIYCGTWSHKPGLENVTKYDGSGQIIMDPETCDRTSYSANYSMFLGYYAIMPLNTEYGV